jgi:RNA recognition motif-containing protein
MTSIFVAKLDFGVTSEQLRKLFEQHGKVLKANVATDRETGKSRGFAFVEMADRTEATNAINALNNHVINGRTIAVKEADARGDRENKPARSHDNNSRPPRSEKPVFQNKTSEAIVTPVIPEIPAKIEPRKKLTKDKKAGESDSDNRSKKPKMDAYKKSGKNNKFFDDDDEDFDEDLFSYKRKDEEDLFDDEDDEEDF